MIQTSCQGPAILWNPIGKKCGKIDENRGDFFSIAQLVLNAEPRSTGEHQKLEVIIAMGAAKMHVDNCDSNSNCLDGLLWEKSCFFASWSIYPQSFIPIII